MTDPARGQHQQMPISSGIAVPTMRTYVRPSGASISSNAVIPRQAFGTSPLVVVPRGGLSNLQPNSQPSLVSVRSFGGSSQSLPTNGVAALHTRPMAANSSAEDTPLVKFLRHVLEMSMVKKPQATQESIVIIIQKLVDGEVECEKFCMELCNLLMSYQKRSEVENLVRSHIAQLRRDLSSGAVTLPYIRAPLTKITTVAPTSVFIGPAGATNAVSTTSHILPRPTDGLPIGTNFHIPQGTTVVSINSTVTRPGTPILQGSVYSPRPNQAPIAPSTPQTIRPHIRPQVPIRMKGPNSPVVIQAPGSASIGSLTPQRAPILTANTSASWRQIYPNSSSVVVTPQVNSVAASTPASCSTTYIPLASAQPGVSTPIACTTSALSSSSSISTSQLNKPFFPASQVREHLKSVLPEASMAMLSKEATEVMAQGLEALLREVLERVSVVASHKAVKLADDPRFQQSDYAREQLHYLQRLDEHEQRKKDEMEKEYIMKVAKSRTRTENPDQARIRELANQLKNEQVEREKQLQANRTALNAIGLPPSKRPRTSASEQNLPDTLLTAVSSPAVGSRLSLLNSSGATASCLRLVPASGAHPPSASANLAHQPSRFSLASSLRIRRAGVRELQAVFSKDARLCRSRAFFRTHWR